jgi:hypothetical protein
MYAAISCDLRAIGEKHAAEHIASARHINKDVLGVRPQRFLSDTVDYANQRAQGLPVRLVSRYRLVETVDRQEVPVRRPGCHDEIEKRIPKLSGIQGLRLFTRQLAVQNLRHSDRSFSLPDRAQNLWIIV